MFASCLLIVQLHVAAQGQPPVNRNKTTNPTNTINQGVPGLPPVRTTDLSDTANENRLVALAMKGPEFDATVHQGRINELELKRAKGTWLNLLSISTNYNDQSFAKQPAGGQAAYVYPKYFFGVTIPLGIIFSQGNQVKTARESIANGKDQQEILARTIRASILSKYKQYKEYAALIEMQSELMNDVLANATQAEQNFTVGYDYRRYLYRRSANEERGIGEEPEPSAFAGSGADRHRKDDRGPVGKRVAYLRAPVPDVNIKEELITASCRAADISKVLTG